MDKTFLNEGEFQGHKNLYKNKELKKVYEEKNVLKPMKDIAGKFPDVGAVSPLNETQNDQGLENLHDSHIQHTPTILSSKNIL